MNIEQNLSNIKIEIEKACNQSKRNLDEVTLIAVSKTQPIEAIKEACLYNINNFGENKVQELTEKVNNINNKICWHFIGHLQRNKVKYIIDKVDLIHSVDSLRLAKQINIEAKKHNIKVNVLIQVNVSNEETKYGIAVEQLEELVKNVSKLSNVQVKGLMTIAPYVKNPEDNRTYFKKLKQLSVDIKNKNIDNISMEELSMGMTNDYKIAIEEGSTLVRIGTGIFGSRIYI